MNWILTWKIIFIFVLAAFAVMTVLTIFFGARDVKHLLRDLKSDEKSSEDDVEE